MRPSLLMTLATALSAGPVLAEDAGVNAIYDRLSAAYETENALALAEVYTKDAVVFPSQPNTPWVIGHERIVNGPGAFLAKVKAQGGALAIRFRVTGRRMLGTSVIDTGLYHLTVADAAGKASVQVGKFLTVAVRQPDGNWAFIADTDTPMPAAAWDEAKQIPGARFDR